MQASHQVLSILLFAFIKFSVISETKAQAPATTTTSQEVNGISIIINNLQSDHLAATAAVAAATAAATAIHDDDDDEDGLAAATDAAVKGNHSTRRSKRSLAQAKADFNQQQLHKRRPFVDCNRLAGLWEFMSSSYPALGDYLFSLAVDQLETTAGSHQHQSASLELGQTVRLIGQLLSEADQLAREKHLEDLGVEIHAPAMYEPSTKTTTTTATAKAIAGHRRGSNLQHQLAVGGRASGWLARVVANPAYAKIVQQHFLLQRQQQQQQSDRARHRFAKQHLEEAPNSGGAATAAADRSQVAEAGGASFGRVAHFPRELEPSRATSTGRTLDKLHILNGNHARQSSAEAAQFTNEIGARPAPLDSQVSLGALGSEPLESNQIPLIESESAELDLLTSPEQQQQKPISSPAADPKVNRPKYVYGSVLLRPSQAKAAANGGSADNNAQLPIDKLRNFNNQMHNINNHHHNRGQAASSALQDKSTETNAYGRVVVSPQSNRDQQQQQQQQQQQLSISMEQQSRTVDANERPQIARTSGSLTKLRDQLQPSQFGSPVLVGNGASSSTDHLQQQPLFQGESDEISNQQQASSLAAIVSQNGDDGTTSAFGSAADPPLGVQDEFEGTWHSSPLEHVEASRQARRNSGSSDHNEADRVRLTTSSPGEVLVID